MSSSTALTLTNNMVSTLQGYFTAVLPIVFPVVIGVMILFAVIGLLKMLWHRHI